MSYPVRVFATAEEFLASDALTDRGVVVVDLRMPGMSGLELQEELTRRGSHLPLIVLTAHARTPTTVRVIQAGAVTMIDKPYHDNDLWDAIRLAFDKEETAWAANEQRREILGRMATLTSEERRVAELVIQGRPNKAIALETGLAIRTIEKRRHDVLAKMKAESIAELVRLFMSIRNT
jgi:FixJ family two-component response regulator